VLDALRADNGMLAACLGDAHPVELRGNEVVVAFGEHDAFNRRMADGREHRAAIDAALHDLAGRDLRVTFELRDLGDLRVETETKPASEDDLVARFKAEFDAEEIVPDDDEQSDDQEEQP
jgi:hypothetical protein